MRIVISSVLVASMSLASVASAQAPAPAVDAPASAPPASPTPEALKEAADHYQRGLSLYGEGEFVLALVEFERAYQLTPNYRVLYNIGQVRIQLGRYAKGREALEEYLKQGGASINAARTEAVKKDLDMLAERTAMLSVLVNEPGADVAVDGRVVGVSPLTGPLVIDAGEHTLDVRKAGFYDKSSQVTLAGRDQIEVKLELLKIPEAQASRVIVERTDKAPPTKAMRTAAYVGWTATGTLAVTAGVLGYFGITKANQLESMRTDYGVSRAQLDGAKSNASTLLLAADITGGLAAVAGGVSLYLTIASREHPPQPSSPKPGTVSTSMGLGFSPQGIRLRGTF
jgi:tetratricopeptide (TPR) repeat protein